MRAPRRSHARAASSRGAPTLALAVAVTLVIACAGARPNRAHVRETSSHAAAMQRGPSFVERRGACLVREGRPIRFVGSNAFFLQEQAAREALGEPAASGHLARAFDAAVASGATLLRVAAFHDDQRSAVALRDPAGQLRREGVAGLDRVVAEASRRGVGLVMVLANYWNDYGGVAAHLRRRGLPPDERWRFFVDAGAQDEYLGYVQSVVRHANPLTGRRYADDPTIVAWEVMNEPRIEDARLSPEHVVAFVDRAATRLHIVAPRQLVLVGDEGFDGTDSRIDRAYWERVAPARMVAPARRESHARLVALASIDASSVHWYPSQWGVSPSDAIEAGARWIAEHARIARDAGKPMFLEEVGVADPPLRAAAYRAWFDAASDASNVAAFLPWGLTFEGRPGAPDGFEWLPADVAAIREFSRRWTASPHDACGTAISPRS